MLSTLEKYNQLPQEWRDEIVSPVVQAVIKSLELNYKVKLSQTIMKIMTGEVELDQFTKYFLVDFLKIDNNQAENLAKELEEKVFLNIPLNKKNQFKPEAFNDEDQIEINKIKQKIEIQEKSPQQILDEKIDLVEKKIHITFPSSVLNNRLRDILKTALNGTREYLSVREILRRAVNLGGLGLDEKEIEKIILTLKDLEPKSNFKKPSKPTIFQERDVAYSITNYQLPITNSKLPITNHQIPTTDNGQGSLKKTSDKPINISINQDFKESNVKIQNKENNNPKNEIKKNKTSFFNFFKPKLSSPLVKLKMENKILKKPERIITEEKVVDKNKNVIPSRLISDIAKPQQLFGPTDELANLNLITFRRLHSDPLKAIIKIEDKINLIAGYRFKRHSEGVKALHTSPLFKMYFQVINTSINNLKTIEETIDKLNQEEHYFLNQSEFKALTVLNDRLKLYSSFASQK